MSNTTKRLEQEAENDAAIREQIAETEIVVFGLVPVIEPPCAVTVATAPSTASLAQQEAAYRVRRTTR